MEQMIAMKRNAEELQEEMRKLNAFIETANKKDARLRQAASSRPQAKESGSAFFGKRPGSGGRGRAAATSPQSNGLAATASSHAARNAAGNITAAQSNQRPASMQPTAEELREEGNRLFKAGKYAEARQAYSSSLSIAETCLAFANRAMAELKLRDWHAAECDCTQAIQLDETYVKAYQRRAAAKVELGRMLEAADDFDFAVRLQPSNKGLAAERSALIDRFHSQPGAPPRPVQQQAIPVLLPQPQQQQQQQQSQASASAALAASAAPAASEAAEPAVMPRAAVSAKLPTSEQSASRAVAAAAATLVAKPPAAASPTEQLLSQAATRAAAASADFADEAATASRMAPEHGFNPAAKLPVLSAADRMPPAAASGAAQGQAAAVTPIAQPSEEAAVKRVAASPVTAVPLQATPPPQPQATANGISPAAAAPISGGSPATAAMPSGESLVVSKKHAISANASKSAASPAAAPMGDRQSVGVQLPVPPVPEAQQQASQILRQPVSSANGSVLPAAQAFAPAKLVRPTTGLEFECTWRMLAGQPERQMAYLLLLGPAALPQLFKHSLTAALLEGMLPSLLAAMHEAGTRSGAEQARQAAELLAALPQVPRFDLAVMSFGAAKKQRLAQLWDDATAAAQAEDPVARSLAAARAKYRF